MLHLFSLLGVVNGANEEVDVPSEGVLVHGLNVGQVGNAEKQDGGVDSNGRVPHTGVINLLLSLFSNGLGEGDGRG